jgi:PAS domain S-box-containing protein
MQRLSPELARSALDAAPDAIVIIDDSGVICFANRQVSALFGYIHDELIGKPVECLMPERFRDQHPELRRSYNKNIRTRPMGVGLDLSGQRKDGTEFPVEISLSPIDDAGRLLVAGAIRDVSERKHIEDELCSARDSADRANQAKSRFLATASHDLRQPVQTLSLLAGTLRRISKESAVQEAVAHQEQAIAGMSRLLNALLDISKLEAGIIKPDPSDFVMDALFEELRLEFAGLAGDKGLSLEVSRCEESVHSDLSLVGQILRNLLSNAIKYTRAGLVALRCLPLPPSFVRVEVLDTGIGIPAEQLRYIYDEFYQIGIPANTTREGYGLGLSIVQRLVSLLGAKLEVVSEPGKGSTFALILPAAHAPLHQEVVPRAGSEPTTTVTQVRASVLLVEDDPAVRNATRMLLKSDGYDVIVAATMQEALQQAGAAHHIDLLVADYHLGDGVTGLHVIGALHAALGRPLKAVLVTGDTSSAITELPRDPHLRIASKPVNPDELLATLRALLDS